MTQCCRIFYCCSSSSCSSSSCSCSALALALAVTARCRMIRKLLMRSLAFLCQAVCPKFLLQQSPHCPVEGKLMFKTISPTPFPAQLQQPTPPAASSSQPSLRAAPGAAPSVPLQLVAVHGGRGHALARAERTTIGRSRTNHVRQPSCVCVRARVTA